MGPITFAEWADCATLASRLRNAEAHPEHGRWIWLHITLARTWRPPWTVLLDPDAAWETG